MSGNLCSACGETFSTVTLFDLHRTPTDKIPGYGWKINSNQELVGRCIPPSWLLLVQRKGAWYTPEGASKAERGSVSLGKARNARSKKG